MQENKPILIVGLGNPGGQFAGTRHNAGFMAVDHLAGPDAVWKKEKNALVVKLHTPQSTIHILLAKPQTYMNDSGAPVRELMKFYKIPPENLTVIHDDLDLKPGAVREKIGGGSAGHNGIKSIDAAVGPEYRRIRIGIGHPRDCCPAMDVSDWVLGKIPSSDLKEIENVIRKLEL